MLINTLLMSLREIRRNLLRSGLTVLGIIIGVAAVIIIVTLGAGTTRQVQDEISKMGSNMLVLSPGAGNRMGGQSVTSPPFDLFDLAAIRREVEGLGGATPVNMRPTQVVVGNENRRINIMGSDSDFSSVRNWKVVEGRLFTASEVRSGKASCIVGSSVKRDMFNNQSPIGATLRIGKVNCVVIGSLESKGQAMFGGDQDEIIVVPIRLFQRRLSGNTRVDNVYLSARTPEEIGLVKTEVEKLMRERRQIADDAQSDFNVRDMTEVSTMVQSTTGVLTGFLSAIAAVSLLVGGIGIMNIMLVSVTERTREIGIRLAIGALEKEVMLQFLIEAAMLSAFGGLVGILLGLLGAAAIAPALNVPFILQPSTVMTAFAFSAAVGVVFGFMPARRAARLDPIEALRHE
ncbi:MAG: FtsX-like permease family protein [Alphaproteobacteria bacterium]|nr:FtsX-like permease family protein [Alphaproteobacteria bacterium]